MTARGVFPLLRQMADGRFHSGDDLARAMGVSRATVWQRIGELQHMGLDCHRVRGRGYRLAQPIDLLDATALQRDLVGTGLQVQLVEQVTSTSSALLAGAEHLPHGSVLVAEWQSAGRGRRGSGWSAVPGQGLTFSLLWRFATGVQALGGLSLAVGVALARACSALGAGGVGVKWPNDLLFDGRKLGGVLVEVQGDALGPSAAVIGVGMNVHAAPQLNAADALPAAALAEAMSGKLQRGLVLTELLRHMAVALADFERQGLGAFSSDWRRLHAWNGRLVGFPGSDGRQQEGVAVDIDSDGALLVETCEGRQRVLAGDVRLRPAPTRGIP